MSRSKIARLSELQHGDTADFFAVLASRKRDVTRDGKPYYQCRFRDARRTASFMVWLDGGLFEVCQNEWREGQCFKIRAAYGEHERYGPQIDIVQIRPVRDEDREHGFDPLDFVERSRFDPAATFVELRALIEAEIADEPLRRLVLTVLDGHRERLLMLPASQRHYHPFAGGWLEHTLSVTRSCVMLIERYRIHYAELTPPLNRDLLLAGAALHEIGRVAELDASTPPQPTIPGRLLGHLYLSRDLVRDAAREQGDVNPELVQLLEHLLVSYLALPEWGSPRLPAIPECLILHHADDLDAKLEMYVRCLTRDVADGPFTDPDPVLKKPLFKGRSI
jgi:3'-5' exoribonuclease